MTSRLITFFSTLIFLTGLSSCIKPQKIKPKDCSYKNQECDTGILYLGNMTNEGISYSEGSNILDKLLRPGQVVPIQGGHVKVEFDEDCTPHRYGFSTLTLETEYGAEVVYVDRCVRKYNFRYDKNDPGSKDVVLYDETED